MYKFAIIGCGRIAHRHAAQIIQSAQLLAVCDTDKEKADAFGRQYGAAVYYTVDQLLKEAAEVEVVTVCSPNGLHAEHSIKAIQAGRHVLCEKPMCITAVAAWQMLDASHFFRRKLFIVKPYRFTPTIKAIKELLAAGSLGTITGFQFSGFWNRTNDYYTESAWRGTADLDGGILYTQFSHFIDLLYWLLGDVDQVSAMRKNFLHTDTISFEDSGAVVMQMQSGAIGSFQYTINSFGENAESAFLILGDRGTIKISGKNLDVVDYFKVDGIEQPLIQNDGMTHEERVYRHVFEQLQQKGNTNADTVEAAKTIEIIEKIYKSSSVV